ncbi:hypothetical protein CS535_13015 [Yersinia massiliensis]|uniref:Uncharacterized protein n=1 Tax=Yersinia massiliensis TaxID=419257 RepID=A0ABM6UXM1_9GAMM|nr:hypothetical protein DA391_19565 [Yersinia massiliensis]OWF74347.1 hypothetical protein B4902_06100 [Yersinia frederiksenii]PHZ23117.1 hypothetical protein CS535_13015 [Yersinia massiliensis]
MRSHDAKSIVKIQGAQDALRLTVNHPTAPNPPVVIGKSTKDSPKSLPLQVGSKRANPDELTQVSDSGE